jgi:hypothetical protein
VQAFWKKNVGKSDFSVTFKSKHGGSDEIERTYKENVIRQTMGF